MTDEDYEFNRIERESLMRMEAVKAAVPKEKDMTKEAMKLALEAITAYLSESPDPSEEAVEGLCDARALLRKALAEQPAPEAGTWYAAKEIDAMVRDLDVAMNGEGAAPQAKLCDLMPTLIKRLTEQPAQQEPVAWERPIVYTPPHMTPPAQRKPLTLGQKQRLWSSVGGKPTLKDRVNAYGLAIEAAHNIKENT